MKFFKLLIVFIVIGFNANAQKTNLSKATCWNVSSYNFNDGSYLVNYNGKINDNKWERVLVYYDVSGKKVKEQKLDGDTQWDFANDVKKFPGKEAIHSVIDPEKKICYTLYASPKEAKVFVTGLDFQPKEFIVSPEPFQLKYALVSGYFSYMEVFGYLNSDGNPVWWKQYQKDGFSQITFDIKSGTASTKYVETDEIKELEYRYIGRMNNKNWLVKIGEKDPGKPFYKLKFFSVTDDAVLKLEAEYTIPKDEKTRLLNARAVRTVDDNKSIYVSVSHHDGKVESVGGLVKEVDFIKFDGDIKVTNWKSGSTIYSTVIPLFTQHKIKDDLVRFVLDDNNGRAISINVDFKAEKAAVNDGIETKNNMTFQGSDDIYNFLLYWDELSSNQKRIVKEIMETTKDISYVFPKKKSGFVIIRGYNFFVGLKGDHEVSGEVVE